MRSPHARHRLDEVIHAPVRFSIVATLAAVDEAEFALVRDEVEVSDSVLSKQVSTLEQAGYVRVRKGYVGKRPAHLAVAHPRRAHGLRRAPRRAARDRRPLTRMGQLRPIGRS